MTRVGALWIGGLEPYMDEKFLTNAMMALGQVRFRLSLVSDIWKCDSLWSIWQSFRLQVWGETINSRPFYRKWFVSFLTLPKIGMYQGLFLNRDQSAKIQGETSKTTFDYIQPR